MGAIISRWRKKPTTVEKLEEIEKEMDSLHKLRRQNLQKQKKVIGQLIVWSIVIYIVIALLFYFCYFPKNWKERLIHTTPLLAFPLLFWGTKRLLHWYFVKRITKNESTLQELRDKRKEILEDVMENETYKKAKEILEKFDPDRFKQLEKPLATPPTAPPAKTPSSQSAVRQRVQPTPPQSANRSMMGATPRGPRPVGPRNPPSALLHVAQQLQRNGQPRPGPSAPGMSVGPQLPRPILPRERSAVDKLVEYLVGDGPQNRYALICKYCSSHNGMALQEEFEYISFKCCYCYLLNPAKKFRPNAPRLPEPPPVQPKVLFEPKGGSPGSSPSSEASADSAATGTDSEHDEGGRDTPSSRGTTPEPTEKQTTPTKQDDKTENTNPDGTSTKNNGDINLSESEKENTDSNVEDGPEENNVAEELKTKD